MHRHPYFDLVLHDEAELAKQLGSTLLERTTVHEWPLSCVQRLRTADGQQVIYKSQRVPSVETEFYSVARSPLLVSAKTIYRSDEYACLILGVVDGTLLKDLSLTEGELVTSARAVTRQIQEIEGNLPCVLDVSNEDNWLALVHSTLEALEELIDRGEFTRLTKGTLRALGQWALDACVVVAIRERSGYLHGDLTDNNVFQTSDGFRVIDWQYPKRGPTDVDLATLLGSGGVDPTKYVGPGIIRVMDFLRIQWFAACASRWFAPGAEQYEAQIAEICEQYLG